MEHLPNDTTQRIACLRERSTHRQKFSECMLVIEEAREFADDYCIHNIEDENGPVEWDGEQHSEWEYAFWDYFED